MLLEHGPLTLGEFVEITGWPRRTCDRILQGLWLDGMVVKTERGLYSLPAARD